jgi:hypothetical protein
LDEGAAHRSELQDIAVLEWIALIPRPTVAESEAIGLRAILGACHVSPSVAAAAAAARDIGVYAILGLIGDGPPDGLPVLAPGRAAMTAQSKYVIGLRHRRG